MKETVDFKSNLKTVKKEEEKVSKLQHAEWMVALFEIPKSTNQSNLNLFKIKYNCSGMWLNY